MRVGLHCERGSEPCADARGYVRRSGLPSMALVRDVWLFKGLGVSRSAAGDSSREQSVDATVRHFAWLENTAYPTFADVVDAVCRALAGWVWPEQPLPAGRVPGLGTHSWWLGGVAAAFLLGSGILWLAGRTDGHLAAPPPGSQEQSNLGAAVPTEPAERPPVAGSNIALTRDNIRYCLFQQVRLEALGPLTDAVDLAIFDALASDWNARCARAQYPSAEKDAVGAELAWRREALEAQGREFTDRWRRRTAARIGSVPSGVVAPAAAAASNGAQPPFREMPPEMSTLPAVVTAQMFWNGAAASAPSKPPSLMLLRTYVAARVQRRLSELGYTIAPADGTWGPMSRTALRRFKQANGLLWDDALDAETVARLFSMAAVSRPPQGPGDPDGAALTFEAFYPPPPGATMNPLNRPDARWIEHRLAMLGYYVGEIGLWGAGARAALREFKLMNHLPNDDEWDAATEAALNSEAPGSASDALVARRPKYPIGVCDAGNGAAADVIPNIGMKSEVSRAAGDVGSPCRSGGPMTDPPGMASSGALPVSLGSAPVSANAAVGGHPTENTGAIAAPRAAPRPPVPLTAPRRSAPSG